MGIEELRMAQRARTKLCAMHVQCMNACGYPHACGYGYAHMCASHSTHIRYAYPSAYHMPMHRPALCICPSIFLHIHLRVYPYAHRLAPSPPSCNKGCKRSQALPPTSTSDKHSSQELLVRRHLHLPVTKNSSPQKLAFVVSCFLSTTQQRFETGALPQFGVA